METSLTWVDLTPIAGTSLAPGGGRLGSAELPTDLPVLPARASPYRPEGNLFLATSLEDCSMHFLPENVFSL